VIDAFVARSKTPNRGRPGAHEVNAPRLAPDSGARGSRRPGSRQGRLPALEKNKSDNGILGKPERRQARVNCIVCALDPVGVVGYPEPVGGAGYAATGGGLCGVTVHGMSAHAWSCRCVQMRSGEVAETVNKGAVVLIDGAHQRQ